MTIAVEHTVSGWVFVYGVTSIFVVAMAFAILMSVGEYVSGLIQECYRTKVLGQKPKSERLKK